MAERSPADIPRFPQPDCGPLCEGEIKSAQLLSSTDKAYVITRRLKASITVPLLSSEKVTGEHNETASDSSFRG
jgi:hypothetical protein